MNKEEPHPVFRIEQIVVGPFKVNAYVVGHEQDPAALVIDPGEEAVRIEQALDACGARPAGYLITHGHADHLCALAALVRRFPAPVFMSAEDTAWAFGPTNCIPPYYDRPEPPPEPIRTFQDDALVNADPFVFRVIATPGHSPGGVCYYFERAGLLFTGDTLFEGTVGRTDLPAADSRVLAQSLKKLAALPDDVRVYPGHGRPTTIGAEKRNNIFMRQAARG